MKTLLKILILTFVLTICCNDSFALSNYGRNCDENDDCVSCKNDVKCLICMNACYNLYGPADTDDAKFSGVTDKLVLCIRKEAKWCNAQCWDPDNTKDPDYVTTRPDCKRFGKGF